ncbi:hypothetical protein O181_054373 [Austropuccinia psidii MF-1]|uniref:Uncharacterized protein n=1 Tax=Austropuccinia psidii MF-1 TaxID=1389203 RepID=A0A9Q3HRD0_9BASI|nr:hypothetical protein [Austropuccinia psidii MF-1]
MTSTRSGSNYSIQSNGSGTGYSSNKFKIQDCQPRGEVQIEDARNLTSSQRLASTFYTILESPEAEITDITVVISEKLSASSNGIYQSQYKNWFIAASGRTILEDESLVDKPKHFVRGPEEIVGPKELQQPVEAFQATTSKDPPQQVPKKGKQAPKRNQKGKQKAQGKAKPKWNKPYPHNHRIPKREKTAMDNVFNMERTLMEFRTKEDVRINQSFPKK